MGDVLVKCWCGVEGPANELFRREDLDEGCGGWGYRTCRCGGDHCVCHHHGAIDCNGCPECDEDLVLEGGANAAGG
ncbi:MAG TPA: hypothetical protein VFG69_15275 [Nannocystaceae bacterium]|nr:hypothetical protein [Nannocystaceae bacterium]